MLSLTLCAVLVRPGDVLGGRVVRAVRRRPPEGIVIVTGDCQEIERRWNDRLSVCRPIALTSRPDVG